jgi:Na+/H+ antiporter NhaD/arsenite permease-like protein
MYARSVSLILFIAAYCLFVFFPNRRSQFALVGAGLLVILGGLSLSNAFNSISWNVMGIFVGTLAVTDVFIESRVPAYLAETIVNRSKNTAWAILLICAMTGLISAFVENVATVLIVAPIALALARKLKINPMNMMIAIAVSSNLQGAATLIGDPPSMLLGGFAKMNFMDFFFYHGRPSIFFAVQLGAVFSFFVLYYLFHNFRRKEPIIKTETIKSLFPSALLVVLVLLLAGSSFVQTDYQYAAGTLCMIAGAVSLVWGRLVLKNPVINGLRSIDWDTTLFLVSVFVLVGGVTYSGWIEAASIFLSGLIGKNIFLGYTIIVFVSVAVSAFVDNVPFLAAMLPLALSMSNRLGISPSLFLFGLLIGASLGGNITPIGASANIVACGMLKKEGYSVSFGDFMRIGIPFTIAAVLPAYIFIWLVWR